MKKKRKKASRSVRDVPQTPVSSLSVVISYLQALAIGEQAAATYNGYAPPYTITDTVNACTALLQGLIVQYGGEMTSQVMGSLNSAITNLSGATTFDEINAVLDTITISTDVLLYSSNQTASQLVMLIIQGTSTSASIDALVSVILANVPADNVDGLSSGSPSILSSLFPMNYPDANDLEIFPYTDSNINVLTICLIYRWTRAQSPSNAGAWLVGGAGASVVSMYLDPTMKGLGSNPTTAQIQTLTNMLNDLGNFFDPINKDVGYKLPDYGDPLAQFSKDLKYYDNKVITPVTLQQDYQALLSAFGS